MTAMMTFWKNWWNQSIGPKHWHFLLIVNAVIMTVYLTYHVLREPFFLTYAHLLVDYHFGLTKRALIGAILALFTDTVPVWMVFALSGVVLIVTFLLYVRLFQKTFGFSNATAPLAVFIFGSPFFFKHFIKSMGYFDIYGCLLAIVVLLMPANSLAIVAVAGIGSIVLLFIHHIHMLLFIPVIGAIVITRFYMVRETSLSGKLVGVAFVVALFAIFVGLQFFGSVKATPVEFRDYLRIRMGDHGDLRALDFAHAWFRTYTEEIKDTWKVMQTDFWFIWAYVLLFAVHWPLYRYFRACVLAIESVEQRRIVIALIAMIALGYGVILATVFDYGRWVSSWVVCMILMLHAIRALKGAADAPLIPIEDRTTFRLACGVTAIPKVGVTRPFE